jgi:hypothetical protein
MTDYTLTSDHKNPLKNYATVKAEMMTLTERWEEGFDQGYFMAGCRLSLGDYQEYKDGWFCGWSALYKIRNAGNTAKLIQWEEQKDNYRMGKAFRVPYQLAPKKRFTLPCDKLETVAATRKNFEINWKVEIALGTLNVLVHQEGMDFDGALWETLNTHDVPRGELTAAYDNQVITYSGQTVIEFGPPHANLSPQAQAEADLVDLLLSDPDESQVNALITGMNK